MPRTKMYLTTCPTCGRKSMTKNARPGCKEHRAEAELRVIAARGSSDVPGFEACVAAELKEMAAELNIAMVNDGL